MAILGAFALLIYGSRTIRATREQLYVSRVLETTLETVRYLSWQELAALPASQTFDATRPLVALFPERINPSIQLAADFEGTPYSPTGTILIDSVSGVTDLKRVTVRLSYSPVSRRGTPVTASLVTYISKNGIDRR